LAALLLIPLASAFTIPAYTALCYDAKAAKPGTCGNAGPNVPSVVIKGSGAVGSATSDSNGYAQIPIITEGIGYLNASAIGYSSGPTQTVTTPSRNFVGAIPPLAIYVYLPSVSCSPTDQIVNVPASGQWNVTISSGIFFFTVFRNNSG
jgi:hypothetical protein